MVKMNGGEGGSRRWFLRTAAGAAAAATGLTIDEANAAAPNMAKGAFVPVPEGYVQGGEDFHSEEFGDHSYSQGAYDWLDLEEYTPTESEKQRGIIIAPGARQGFNVLNTFGELATLAEADGSLSVNKGIPVVSQTEEKPAGGHGPTELKLETEKAPGGVLRARSEGETVEARRSSDGAYIYISYATSDGSGEWFTVQPTLSEERALVRRGRVHAAEALQEQQR